MDRFRNILAIYHDRAGADSVLVQAVSLARANGAKLTVVGIEEAPRTAAVVDEARRHLRRIVPWIVQEGVREVETDVMEGTPYVAIIRRALRDDHDLVIISADDGHAFRDLVAGGTARHLLQKCPCAVWVIKPHRPTSFSGVLAAVDPAVDAREEGGLNAKILDLAVAFARSNAACLHTVHCWDVGGADGEALRSELHIETKNEILDRHRSQKRQAVEALLSRYARWQIEHEVHLPRGRPEFELAGLADRLSVDVVVMGTAGRGGLSRWLLGDFAEDMLGMVRCGILAVKPDDFRTPVVPPSGVGTAPAMAGPPP